MNLLRYLPRFREATRAVRVLSERERWSRGDIEQFQLQRLNAMWTMASTTVPYYADLTSRRKLPPAFESVREFVAVMPVLSKRTIAANPRSFLSSRAAPGQWLRTGGSTGEPLSVYWSSAGHREMLWARYCSQLQWGVEILDRSAQLWGEAYQSLADRIFDPLFFRLRGRILLSAYRLGTQDLHRYLDLIARFRPASIYGYSSAVGLLAHEAAARGLDCDSLKLITLTGEPASRTAVRAVERGFQIPTVVEYGSTECPIIATEGPDRSLRVREDMVLLETVARRDGHHDVVLTTLNNPSFPLIRYAIEDVTGDALEKPERGFARLHAIGGRANDMLVSRSGRRVHSMGVKHVLEPHRGVRRFRAHQDSTGTLSVYIETMRAIPAPDVHHIAHQLRTLLEGHDVQVELVRALPTITRSGKHRWIVSDLIASHDPARYHTFGGSPSDKRATTSPASQSTRTGVAP